MIAFKHKHTFQWGGPCAAPHFDGVGEETGNVPASETAILCHRCKRGEEQALKWDVIA